MSLALLWPFAGIANPRPYGRTGLTTATWLSDTPVTDIALCELWLTQNGVRINGLFRTHRGYRPPFCVAYHGRLYLEDGHHRVVRYALTHDCPTMPMHVYRMEHP